MSAKTVIFASNIQNNYGFERTMRLPGAFLCWVAL